MLSFILQRKYTQACKAAISGCGEQCPRADGDTHPAPRSVGVWAQQLSQKQKSLSPLHMPHVRHFFTETVSADEHWLPKS